MRLIVTRRSAANFIFIIGFFLMFLGSAFLIESLMDISRISILLSFFLMILGICCAVFAIRLNLRSLYLFFAALFLQAGVFLFLYTLHIIPFHLSRLWPLLSVFSGIALFPAGWHKYRIIRANYLVPSVAFIILGAFLMVFALDIVPLSLAQFLRKWWSLVIVIAGLILLLISLVMKYTGEHKNTGG